MSGAAVVLLDRLEGRDIRVVQGDDELLGHEHVHLDRIVTSLFGERIDDDHRKVVFEVDDPWALVHPGRLGGGVGVDAEAAYKGLAVVVGGGFHVDPDELAGGELLLQVAAGGGTLVAVLFVYEDDRHAETLMGLSEASMEFGFALEVGALVVHVPVVAGGGALF
jgi:hypothetical protein